MELITKEYLLLFNTITDAEETLRQLRDRLLFAQRQAEELYMRDCGESLPAELKIS